MVERRRRLADLPFGIVDFPLLPGGRPLWVEASPDEVRLSERLSELPPSILILTGAKLRAAAVVSGGDLIDAVWIDSDDHARGETAGMALLGATKGSLAGYALDDPRVAEALTMLWRLPVAVSGVELSWLDPASMLAAFRADGLDRVLVIDAPVRGIALFSRGGLVAVYSETQRSAVASPERLRSLLSQARGRLTVMERKPRPLAADATKPPTAHDFFELAPADAVSVQAGAVSVQQPVTEDDSVADEQPAAGDHPAGLEPVATSAVELAPESSGAETGAEPASDHVDFAASEAPPPPPPEDEVAASTDGAPPPPPPEAEAPAAEAPAAETPEPADKPKRSRWGFGRSRKSRAEKQAAEVAAAVADVAATQTEASTFAGWSVREPNEEPQPVWQRSYDVPQASPPSSPGAEDASDDEPAATSAIGDAGIADKADEPQPAPTSEIGDAGIAATEADEPVEPQTATWSYAATAEAPPDIETPHDSTQEHEGAAETAGGDDGFEFASLDEQRPEPAPQATSENWMSDSWLDDVASGDEHSAVSATEPDTDAGETDPDEAAGDADHVILELPRAAPVLRTPGPWSWPLAEPDEEAHAAEASDEPRDEPGAPEMEPAVVAVPRHEETAAAFESGVDSGFFQRDEPVGSQYVDFDEVRDELVQIGVVWLGEANAVQVTALLSSTRSTIDDFVATIDTIRGLHIDGQDPASIQAMAREMHQQAAERLCGA